MPLVLIIPRLNKPMVLIYLDGRTPDDEKEGDHRLVANESELKVEFDNMCKRRPLILDVKLPSCRTTSSASIPIGLVSSEMVLESLRRCRRTRSANDLGGLLVEHASAAVAGSGDVTVSPSPMAGSFVKSSLFFQLGTLDAAIGPFRATSFTFSPMKSSGLTGSPLDGSSPLPLGPSFAATPPGGQTCNLKRSESLLVPCSSSSSTGSCQSNSKGVIYCVRKNGSLKMLFKQDGDKGKVFVSNVHKIEASVDMAMDYLYTFRSMTGRKASECVGKMRVFSSLILNPDRSRSVETEFVLFGAEERSKEAQGATKIHGLSKKVANMFRSNNSSKHRVPSRSGNFEGSGLADRRENGLRPSLELAAVVVRSSPINRIKNEAEPGGWGLKFLERVAADHADASADALLRSESVDVLVPAGLHGGPITGDGGPSTLAERWRSGGRCDCGGWDIGCPLTVLHDNRAFPAGDSREDGKTVDLFTEGATHAEPALKMVTAADGVFTVYFRPTLSALQAFAVGAAIIHSRWSPEMHPKL